MSNNPAQKTEWQPDLLTLSNVGVANRQAAQSNLNSELRNQFGMGNLGTIATKTTSAANSDDGIAKYTPGRTAASDEIDKRNSDAPARNKATTYTVNAGNQPYVAQLNSLYDQIMNRKPFQYDLNGDLLYRQMADQYAQLGAQASRDAMGQAAALTGGYGNSYATQVGNQANQQYLTALNQNIPELYDRALQAYMAQGDQLLQQYELAAAHPGALDAISPRTYTVSESADESDGMASYLQALQNSGLVAGALAAQPYNALNGYYYTLRDQTNKNK